MFLTLCWNVSSVVVLFAALCCQLHMQTIFCVKKTCSSFYMGDIFTSVCNIWVLTKQLCPRSFSVNSKIPTEVLFQRRGDRSCYSSAPHTQLVSGGPEWGPATLSSGVLVSSQLPPVLCLHVIWRWTLPLSPFPIPPRTWPCGFCMFRWPGRSGTQKDGFAGPGSYLFRREKVCERSLMPVQHVPQGGGLLWQGSHGFP